MALAFHQGSPLVVSHIRLLYVQSTKCEESPEAFRFKCVYVSLCLCCQGPAIASVEEVGYSECSVELGLEADVSALLDDVKF